jgi:hypothetical protein
MRFNEIINLQGMVCYADAPVNNMRNSETQRFVELVSGSWSSQV